ncbi:MAG: FHA domain-containing protein [Metallosphaera sp.]|uniref:FHA domain-containing protein n=1 Tax=Metallosphaera sp. TaxID=2020860 RepID=UPI003162C9EF
MTWKCVGCGTENPDDVVFCTSCGLKKPEEQGQELKQELNQQPSGLQESVTQQESNPTEQQPQVLQTQEAQPENKQAEEQPESQQQVVQNAGSPQAEKQEALGQPIVTEKFYIQFIATPVSSLNKTKVPLDFEVFESISLGRSPENVIMIPDSEISRRHAILYKEGSSLFIEDLNSTNGTYVYDGKMFQAVKGKVQLPNNAVVKLGNTTIVKIVRE